MDPKASYSSSCFRAMNSSPVSLHKSACHVPCPHFLRQKTLKTIISNVRNGIKKQKNWGRETIRVATLTSALISPCESPPPPLSYTLPTSSPSSPLPPTPLLFSSPTFSLPLPPLLFHPFLPTATPTLPLPPPPFQSILYFLRKMEPNGKMQRLP